MRESSLFKIITVCGLLAASTLTVSAHLSGRVFCDSNGNGIQDSGESGIPGVKVTLCDIFKITDVNGDYSFSTADLNSAVCVPPPYPYVVSVDVSTVTGPCNEPSCPTSVMVFSTPALDVNFCFRPPPPECQGQIGDFVWQDLNGNGCQDANEPGIAGVKVDLYSGCVPNITLIKSTFTDSNGKYLFDKLCAGQYTVGFNTPGGFTPTLANQSCSVGGKPADETDSDCDCAGGTPCGICVTLPTDNSVNLTIDCGYIANQPCLQLIKVPDSPTALIGGQMGYTYTITNCGTTTLNNLAIVDDAGTPNNLGDDFTVAQNITLAPGGSQSFHVTVTLPVPSQTALCSGSGGTTPAGSLVTTVLANGDIQVKLTQARTLNDNVYGAPAPADGWSSHSFGNLTGSDKAEFIFENGDGTVVLDFFVDYISAATSKTFPSGTVNYPSGYGTLGANGGDGSLVSGSIANVLFATTSLTDNLNSGLNGGFPSPYLVNSPTPESSFPNWDYNNSYTVIVSKNAFGASGFGSVSIGQIHNSPAKTGDNQIEPGPCAGGCVTNTAVAGVVSGGLLTVSATAHATVCDEGPGCSITTGAVKFDKKTLQIPIKNTGTENILLSELDLSFPAVNGNLVKVSLNGDFWTGSAASPVNLTVANFVADANKRKITPGQTKTLVFTFANNASTDTSLYSGFAKFGDNRTCQVALPPAAPPTPFDCDGHIVELKMRWAGSEPIKVVAHYGALASAVIATIDNVAIGQVVTVNGYLNSPNDVTWEIFKAGTSVKIGESQFHVSCSDSSMDGPEDCGSDQGNGKQNLVTLDGFPTLNNWKFVGLTTRNGTTLLCP